MSEAGYLLWMIRIVVVLGRKQNGQLCGGIGLLPASAQDALYLST
jgi:hypothetical protein